MNFANIQSQLHVIYHFTDQIKFLYFFNCLLKLSKENAWKRFLLMGSTKDMDYVVALSLTRLITCRFYNNGSRIDDWYSFSRVIKFIRY